MSLAIALSNDPVYNLLASGEMLWGDIAELCIPLPATTATNATATTIVAVVEAVEADATGEESDSVPVGPAEDGFYYIDEWDLFHNWDMPDLKLRKNIWENFPVSLIQLPDTDGTDRYSVVWHEKNLRDWRERRDECQSMDEHECYEEFCRARLLRALEAHAHKYRVEPAHGHRQICVIAMVHSDTIATPATAMAPVVAPATTATPVTTVAPAVVTVASRSGKKALDVLKSAPVSWDRDGKIHFVKPHMKKLRDLGLTPNDITFDLMEELSLCDDCVVSSATRKGDICVVTML
ncbi:MAG: hypothetical protein EBT07_07335 [Actinobacteria bacterium]|nr:hypothetical protein [Actinomycetota bacterium]